MDAFAYELWVDRGGTFTDCLLVDRPTGAVRATKVLSTDDAPIVALRSMLGLDAAEVPPPVDVRLGTTLATNALVERRFARGVLVTDRGLEDLIAIRDQARPELFARVIRREPPIPEWIVATDARIRPDGTLVGRHPTADIGDALARARREGAEAVAIALRFSPLRPEAELELEALARAIGFEEVAVSHRVVAEPGFLARLETTVVDAAVSLPLRRYLEGLSSALPGSRIRAMQSDGTLASPDRLRGKDAVLSGPAGGLVAAARVSADAGERAALGFDMGGTSTDVSVVGRSLRPELEGVVAGLRIRAPMLAVHTVAAGGGSICRVVAGRILVGPESAGAFPGPLCYGRSEATSVALTDVALVLGRLLPDHFPFPLDRGRSLAGLAAEASNLPVGSPLRDPVRVASAFFEVAVETMARALADVSIAKGHDPRDHALLVFGGAAGQYACSVARRIGVRRLIVHPFASVLSAYGMGLAEVGATRSAPVRGVVSDAILDEARALVPGLEAALRHELSGEVGDHAGLRMEARACARYVRTETTLELELAGDARSFVSAFEAAHRKAYGIVRNGLPIEIVSVRVAARVTRPTPKFVTNPIEGSYAGPSETIVVFGESPTRTPVVRRSELRTGEPRMGPLVVLDRGGTLVVEPGFELRIDEAGVLFVDDRTPSTARVASTDSDPVTLEVMGQSMASIASRMGDVLRRTATSPNIRDRLDFSCAIFDRSGGLVANAPHIPVHLGAMGDSVRSIVEAHGADLRSGDVYVTNDPASGGSHLPDVTVVSPVFDSEGTLRLFVANRGHHADVGGRVPGSMPAVSSTLEEEGVVLRGLRLVRDGRFEEALLREALAGGPFPARRIDDNVRDLEAQVASLVEGTAALHDSFERFGSDVVTAYVGYLQDAAEAHARHALRSLPFRGDRTFRDALDDGTEIVVRATLDDEGSLSVDFEGTATRHPGNAYAPSSVVKSAVLYLVRVLVGRPIPLNEGCLRAVRLRWPTPSLVAPPPGAAVSSGNVETSQRIVDVLMGALGLGALSQGTMNNVAIGNDRFAYYETIGGGAGASPDSDGASAVHTHMTNSRLTDVEVLESAFPLRVVETSIRRGSGGSGRHRGGDGIVRELELLEDATVSVVSERRLLSPRGASGGGNGASGRNSVDGDPRPGRFEERLTAGRRLRIETPGGGGDGA